MQEHTNGTAQPLPLYEKVEDPDVANNASLCPEKSSDQ